MVAMFITVVSSVHACDARLHRIHSEYVLLAVTAFVILYFDMKRCVETKEHFYTIEELFSVQSKAD